MGYSPSILISSCIDLEATILVINCHGQQHGLAANMTIFIILLSPDTGFKSDTEGLPTIGANNIDRFLQVHKLNDDTASTGLAINIYPIEF